MSEKRKGIPKSVRFEVFKRDSFACQYCGGQAPTVALVVDHIHPVSKGGDNDITNLITSCVACNAGKGSRTLSDETVIAKRKEQLDELQERREQLEMMMEWHRGLAGLDEQQISEATSFVDELIEPFSLNEFGVSTLKKAIKKYGLSETLECARISTAQYLVRGEDGSLDKDSVTEAIDYISRIANNRALMAKKPYMGDLYYIRGICRKRFNYCNEWKAIELLESAYLGGHEIDELKAIAIESRNWSTWQQTMEALITGDSDQ